VSQAQRALKDPGAYPVHEEGGDLLIGLPDPLA